MTNDDGTDTKTEETTSNAQRPTSNIQPAFALDGLRRGKRPMKRQMTRPRGDPTFVKTTARRGLQRDLQDGGGRRAAKIRKAEFKVEGEGEGGFHPKSLSNSLWVPIYAHSTVSPRRLPTTRISRLTLTDQ